VPVRNVDLQGKVPSRQPYSCAGGRPLRWPGTNIRTSKRPECARSGHSGGADLRHAQRRATCVPRLCSVPDGRSGRKVVWTASDTPRSGLRGDWVCASGHRRVRPGLNRVSGVGQTLMAFRGGRQVACGRQRAAPPGPVLATSSLLPRVPGSWPTSMLMTSTWWSNSHVKTRTSPTCSDYHRHPGGADVRSSAIEGVGRPAPATRDFRHVRSYLDADRRPKPNADCASLVVTPVSSLGVRLPGSCGRRGERGSS